MDNVTGPHSIGTGVNYCIMLAELTTCIGRCHDEGWSVARPGHSHVHPSSRNDRKQLQQSALAGGGACMPGVPLAPKHEGRIDRRIDSVSCNNLSTNFPICGWSNVMDEQMKVSSIALCFPCACAWHLKAHMQTAIPDWSH